MRQSSNISIPEIVLFPSLLSLSSQEENYPSFSSPSSRILGSTVSRKDALAISGQSLNRTVFKRDGRGRKEEKTAAWREWGDSRKAEDFKVFGI